MPVQDKMEFVRAAVAWISGMDIIDNCFILNFGYEAPLPWPQVYISIILLKYKVSLKLKKVAGFGFIELGLCVVIGYMHSQQTYIHLRLFDLPHPNLQGRSDNMSSFV